MPLMLFLMVFFASGLFYMIDTGSAIRQKIRLQQAADSAALTQAEWSARSLNVISMNNVAQTQLYTTQIVGVTMEIHLWDAAKKYAESMKRVQKEAKRAKKIPFIGGKLAKKIYAYGAVLTGFYTPVAWHQNKYRPGQLRSYSAEAMEALNEATQYLTDSGDDKVIQQRNGAVALELARLQGATNLYTHNGSACASRNCEGDNDALGIPAVAVMQQGEATFIESANIRLQFCNAKNKGSPNASSRTGYAGTSRNPSRGYDKGRGPWMTRGNGKKVYEYVNETTKQGRKVSRFDWFIRYWPMIRAGWPKPMVKLIPSKGKWVGHGDKRQKSKDNAFLELNKKFDTAHCGPGGVLDVASGGALNQFFSLFPMKFTMPQPAGLIGSDGLINSQGASILGPAARLFAQESESLNVLVIAHSPGKRRHKIQGGEKIASYSYAQAQIYNPTALDLYTQDWRARLVPASFLNGTGCGKDKLPKPQEVLSKLDNSGAEDFKQFTEAFKGFSCEDWRNAIVY